MRNSDVQRARRAAHGFSMAVTVALCSVVGGPRDAQASAPAWAGIERVRVAEEASVLVWEAETKVEHLIRSVTFEGAGRAFAYLVPVPSIPVIAEADERIFEELERFWQERRPSDKTYSFDGVGSVLLSPPSDPTGPEPPVQVLASTRVGGLDAAVLDGGSFVAIGDWLRRNGFEYREELSAWLEPYVRAGYRIAAFKYEKDATKPRVGSRAVRLSFNTPRPFYPYREPSDAGAAPRTFRLYAIGDTSMEANLGEGGQWGAGVRYSGPLRDAHLPFSSLLRPWATFYEEVGPRSASGDLFLRATDAPRLVHATPRLVQEAVMIPVELLALLFVGGVVGVMRLRRSKGEDEELVEQE